jgi:hypothetical protein
LARLPGLVDILVTLHVIAGLLELLNVRGL